MSVKEDDELISVIRCTFMNDVIMVTKNGYLLKFSDDEITPTGLKGDGSQGDSNWEQVIELIKVVLASVNDEIIAC